MTQSLIYYHAHFRSHNLFMPYVCLQVPAVATMLTVTDYHLHCCNAHVLIQLLLFIFQPRAFTGILPTSTNTFCSAPSHYRTAGNTGLSATTIMQKQSDAMPTTGCSYSHNQHKPRSICTTYIPAGPKSCNANTETVRHSSTTVQSTWPVLCCESTASTTATAASALLHVRNTRQIYTWSVVLL